VLDPATHAVRGDLADVRLAEFVFAPHYAAPMACVAAQATELKAERTGGEVILRLAVGDRFDVLELAGDNAWGISPDSGRVGYVARSALDPMADGDAHKGTA